VSLLATGTVVVPQVAGWFAMQEGFIEWDSATRHDQLRLARVDEKRFAVAPAAGATVSARVGVKKGDRVRYSDYVLNRARDDAGVDMPSSFRKLPARLRVRFRRSRGWNPSRRGRADAHGLSSRKAKALSRPFSSARPSAHRHVRKFRSDSGKGRRRANRSPQGDQPSAFCGIPSCFSYHFECSRVSLRGGMLRLSGSRVR
jgi:hypothetical protein